MSWFLKKYDDTTKIKNTSENVIHTKEYDELLRRYTLLFADVETLKATFKILQTDVDNLRGNFNRKLKGIEKSEKEETKEINSPETLYFG